MDRYAVFVDAGYLIAAGAQAAFGYQVPRKHVSILNPGDLIAALIARASEAADGLPLLRIYWYDAMPGPRLSLEQNTLAMLPGVKLRLGALNCSGEQKGVDAMIVTDVIELARNGAIADAVLISGDEDLHIAIQLAQSFGVRVHILAAGDPTKNVSPSIQMDADSVRSLSSEWLAQHLHRHEPQEGTFSEVSNPGQGTDPSAPNESMPLEEAAELITEELLSATPEQLVPLQAHFQFNQVVPPEFDRKLIAKTSRLLGRQFSGEDMRRIRGIFVRLVRARGVTTASQAQ
ncbi:MAG: NYN domain-containing protein [Leptothrix ochracea]|uniref:NYN domain-containing protein n=1 Tax=Leptothrix ochracea TaxID=735331 RepID=UPI0034E19517